jgi:hypothetical protein
MWSKRFWLEILEALKKERRLFLTTGGALGFWSLTPVLRRMTLGSRNGRSDK